MRIAVLRPEPGNAATAARVAALGHEPIRLPLFAVRALAWEAPDPAAFDALLLTSANAVRHGALDALRALPVLAVGQATARAAGAAGFAVVTTGDGGVRDLLDRPHGFRRILHLAGREHRPARDAAVARTIAVYAADPVELPATAVATLGGAVALLHSPRAAARLAELVERHDVARSQLRLAALSDAVAEAAGTGWRGVAVASVPTEDALLVAATRLGD